ncbi:MAG: saccharopine dehydrogenase NADP-binding domain-containing protein [Bacteroidota bacterium]
MQKIFIYGAYGYTGKLIVQDAVEQGLRPVLGGRNSKKLQELAQQYSLDFVAFDVRNKEAWDNQLEPTDVIINCAGPFSETVKYVVPACIRNKTDYLDITGDVSVFKYVASLDQQAKEAGVVLLPGVGFDVVPTDCLAAKLKEKMPDGTHLELAFQGNSGISRGTALSWTKRLHEGGMVRENRQLKEIPLAHESRNIFFGNKERLCISVSLGDVLTAYHTTGIPNIKVYIGVSKKMLNSILSFKKLTWVARTAVMQWILRSIIKRKVTGPSLEKRKTMLTFIWGRISNGKEELVMEMQTMESYQLTSAVAVEGAKRVLGGDVEPGFKTPAIAFGSDFIDQFEKTKITVVNE